MKIKKKTLLNALEKVKPGIAKTDFVESMSYFFFSGTDVITYNDKISIQHPFKTDFSLFVKAQDLYKLIFKLTADTIIIAEKNDKLNIKSKSIQANLSTIHDDEVNERIKNVSKSLKKAKWKKLPDNFITNMNLCYFTASTQESEGTLTCIHVNGVDCVSSDNNRVSHAVLSEKMDEIFVKATEVKNLSMINPIKYATTKAWLHFKNKEGCIFSIRKIDGEFPDFIQFFNFEGVPISLPKEILEGINISSVFVDEIDPSINFKISKGCCDVSVKSDAGSVKHRSKIEYKGKEIKFVINPEFLKQMMTHSSNITLTDDKAKLETTDNNFSLLTSLYG